jgi:hypothetical protein
MSIGYSTYKINVHTIPCLPTFERNSKGEVVKFKFLSWACICITMTTSLTVIPAVAMHTIGGVST